MKESIFRWSEEIREVILHLIKENKMTMLREPAGVFSEEERDVGEDILQRSKT